MRARRWTWVALAGLLAFSTAALGTVYVISFRGGVHGVTATTRIGGPFTLIDDTGATVTEKTLGGKPYTMYFGYTFCPDVCPTTLLDLSRSEIAQIAREYRVYYRKIPTDDGGYTMDHSAIIYLMGSDGKFVTVIPYQVDDASAIAKLKNLAALTPTS